MSLSQKINEDFKDALKKKETIRLSCLRMLKTALKNAQVERGRELTDKEIQSVVSSMVRKGMEAVKEYKAGGREDLALKEDQEIKVYYEYLPQQLTSEEIEKILKEVVSEVAAEGPKDLGKVMKVAMSRMSGQAQGKEVNELARKLLNR
jgi:uncharacterized protein YqeY